MGEGGRAGAGGMLVPPCEIVGSGFPPSPPPPPSSRARQAHVGTSLSSRPFHGRVPSSGRRATAQPPLKPCVPRFNPQTDQDLSLRVARGKTQNNKKAVCECATALAAMNMFKESLLFSPRTRLITFAVLTPIALGTGCLALEMGNPDRIERVFWDLKRDCLPDGPVGRMYAKGEELVAARKVAQVVAAGGAQADGTGDAVAA